MTPDPLAAPATPHRVHHMMDAAGLSPAARTRALALASATPTPRDWGRFATRALAMLGALFLLAGVASLVAWNWARLGRFSKMGLVAAATVAASLVALRELPRLAGQLGLLAAAVLAGLLLAVVGQAYQTGADPWTLFALWALVALPWAIAARFAPLWLLELALADLALVLWRGVSSRGGDGAAVATILLVALVHAIALAAWEWRARRSPALVADAWAARLVVAAGIGALLLAAAIAVLMDRHAGFAGLLALPAFVAGLAALFHWHANVRVDRAMLALAGGAVLALVAVAAGRLLLDLLDLDEVGFLLLALLVIVEIVVGLRWFRRAPRGVEDA